MGFKRFENFTGFEGYKAMEVLKAKLLVYHFKNNVQIY